MTSDEQRMAEALELALQAEGRTRPNPMVGCVVARDGQVLATGFHRRAGEAHGEVDALGKLGPGEADGADLFVNLEPCSTHGRTPPCTDAIIAAGIRRVVVGAVDTNPRHQGAGIAALRAAGIEVVTDVLYEECRALNAPYYRTMETGLPFVSGKWAMSLDGKLATRTGESSWISGEASRAYVQGLRDRHDAVMVGTRTVRNDDPRLTCRSPEGRDPLRVILDARLETPPSARVFDTPGAIVATALGAGEGANALRDRGAILVDVACDESGRLDLEALLRTLVRDHQVMSVLVEGGGELLGSLFDAGLLLRVYAFVAPVLIGGRDATAAFAGTGIEAMADARRLHRTRIERTGDDVLVIGDLVDVHGSDHRHRNAD